jgi:hypothetical protein
MLLGIFMMNAAHSVVHIASGIIFLIAGMAGAGASRMWFCIFGVIYALVAILGFMTPSGMLLGMISNNVADTWLHVILAVSCSSSALSLRILPRFKVFQSPWEARRQRRLNRFAAGAIFVP